MTDPVSGNGHRPELPRPGTGRRRSMMILGLLVFGLPLSFVVRMLTEGSWQQVVSAEVLEQRNVIYLPEFKVFLVHADPPLALRAVSTHLDGPVSYCLTSETFMDLAHGSHWDRRGYYMDGPAPRGLDRAPVRVDNGFIEIDISIVRVGPARGAGPPAPPAGPFCDVDSGNFVPEPSPVPSP